MDNTNLKNLSIIILDWLKLTVNSKYHTQNQKKQKILYDLKSVMYINKNNKIPSEKLRQKWIKSIMEQCPS